ncbi:MAG TPA: response regulator transcription factor [Tenuifilaceae bacterium]|nr:response regulator transcription factor [Tenuifilaceae bacterium]HPE17868.1 response regulator transcription factor [Tenuifilaceae bacterium]HPJ45344.1 response regulator transcription factor [Tenuifilaceae bacterium]HPQ33585.1 response regulator transcription factor [Tenuifilaceae bacterium]HRX67401.1 response regulator transcription factor [Tenuifilaceae bacterium]
MSKIKVALVDDHQIVRDGIKSLLESASNIEIVGEADTAKELLLKLDKVNPNIVIVDISLPDMSGIELTKQIVNNFTEIKVIVLSMHTTQEFIFNAIKSGARGYLPKNITREELIESINQVYAGKEYFSQEISEIILKSYLKQVKNPEQNSDTYEQQLTAREKEILKLVAEGYSNLLIADKLFISVRTVESHKNHIMQKLELTTTVELVKYALKNRIIDL